MHPLEFIALNLKSDQKVELTYIDPMAFGKGEAKTVECFFRGLTSDLKPSAVIFDNIEDLRPVFVLPNKNGKPQRKRVDNYIRFRDIISIWPDRSAAARPVIYPSEIEGYSKGVTAAQDLALLQIQDIADEMATLFGGKRIQLNYPCRVEIIYDSHVGIDMSTPVDILSVGYNQKALYPEFEVDNDAYREILSVDELCIDDPILLLGELMDAIRHPCYDEPLECCVDLVAMDWKSIPDPEPSQAPVLFRIALLQGLRAERWFESLSLEDKRRIFLPVENPIRASFKKKEGREPESFEEAIGVYWSILDDSNKSFYMQMSQ